MANPINPKRLIRFGVFEVDLAARELRKSGVRIKLQDQPFRVLALLLERPGEIVAREELREAIWSDDTFVEFDASLNTSIQKIRQALGDSPTNSRFVETIPRRGYRFLASVDTPPVSIKTQPQRHPAPVKLVVGTGLVALLALILIFVYHRDPVPTAPETPRRFVIPTEADVNRALISPDGRRVAYTTGGSPRSRAVTLWVQDLQRDEPRRIGGPGRLGLVAWSHDSRQLAYMEDSTLFRLPVDGRRPVPIATLDFDFAGVGSWSSDGSTILLAPPSGDQRVVEVQVEGGEYRTVLSAQGEDSSVRYRYVHYLPSSSGTTRIVYQETHEGKHQIVALDLDTTQRTVLASGQQPFYSASGHLLYRASGGLWALPFSAKTLSSTGAPVAVRRGGQTPSVSQDGTLVYVARGDGLQQLVFKDRNGLEIETVGQAQEVVRFPVISPGGDRVVVSGDEEGLISLWLHEIARPAKSRITFGLWADRAVWHPTGMWMAYTAIGPGGADIFSKSADGSGEPTLLVSTPYPEFPYCWSSDGRYLIFSRNRDGLGDLLRLEVDKDGKPLEEMPILETEFDEYSPMLSPDNRFLAYASDKSGRHEVYVRAFLDGNRDWLVSTNGGQQARWRGDGREIYYVDSEGTLFAVPIALSPEFSAGQPERLFNHAETLRARGHRYDVTPDGQRFLVVKVLKEARSVIRVVDNWFMELHKLEAGGP